jgi:SulP family sulfate permease
VTFLHRTSKPAMRTMGFDTFASGRSMVVVADVAAPLPECPQLKMLRMEGEVYFGAVPWVSEQLHQLRTPQGPQRHLLVMAKSMNFIDLAAADMWRQELTARRAIGGDLYFHRPRPQVLELWARLGFVQELGADRVFPSKRAAIAGIFPRLDPAICSRCTVRLYEECQSLPPPRAATSQSSTREDAGATGHGIDSATKMHDAGSAAPQQGTTTINHRSRKLHRAHGSTQLDDKRTTPEGCGGGSFNAAARRRMRHLAPTRDGG